MVPKMSLVRRDVDHQQSSIIQLSEPALTDILTLLTRRIAVLGPSWKRFWPSIAKGTLPKRGSNILTFTRAITGLPSLTQLSKPAFANFVLLLNPRIDVETWDAPGNELATMAATSLRKGLRVAVQGRLRIDKWDDRNTGEKRSRAKVRNRWLSAWVRRKGG